MGLSHLLQVHTLCFIIWFQYQHKIPTFLDVIKTNLSRNSPHTEPVEETTTIPVLQTFAIGSDILLYSATQMEFSATAHQSKTLVVKMNLQYAPFCQEASSTSWTSAQPTCPWSSGGCPTFNIMQCCSYCDQQYIALLYLMKILFRSVQDRDLFIRCSSKK